MVVVIEMGMADMEVHMEMDIVVDMEAMVMDQDMGMVEEEEEAMDMDQDMGMVLAIMVEEMGMVLVGCKDLSDQWKIPWGICII
jgi:hypothetical protein